MMATGEISFRVKVENNQETNNWHGATYHSNSSQQKMVADKLIQQFVIKDDYKILDIGCGDGKITEGLAKSVPKGYVVGIDPSESMISFATENFSCNNLTFQTGKASELNFNKQFDLITSFSALHWEPKQKEALLCFKRALKPGGSVLFAIPGPDPVLRRALKAVCETSKWSNYFKDFQSKGQIWTVNEYAKLLLDTQFEIRKIELVNRSYLFESEESYKGFIRAMLPHMVCVPESKRDSFLNDLIAFVKEARYLDEFGKIRFNVDVLEVIANSPMKE